MDPEDLNSNQPIIFQGVKAMMMILIMMMMKMKKIKR